MRVHFSGENCGGSAGSRDVDGHEADRAGAGDDDILRGNFAGEDGVHGVAERIENGGVVLGDGGIDFPDVADGNFHELGEAPVGIDADDAHILADVRLAHATGAAVRAVDVHFGADEVAGLHGGDFGADGFDHATEFVAEGHGRLDAAGGPAVPAVNVEIGAADRGSFHADENFDGAGGGDGNGLDGGATFGAHLAQGFHLCVGHKLEPLMALRV